MYCTWHTAEVVVVGSMTAPTNAKEGSLELSVNPCSLLIRSHLQTCNRLSSRLPPGASDLLAEEAAADFACLSSQQIDRLSLDSLQYACWSLALSSVGTWPRGVAESTVLVVPQPIALTSGIWLLGLLAAPRPRGEPRRAQWEAAVRP